ncbi:MAG: hypothetical protein ABJB74_15730 [Gemmatimonas sp.]
MTTVRTSAKRSMEDPGATSFGYFMLQVRAEQTGAQAALQLVLENLKTLEKWTFGSSAELGRFLNEWGVVATENRRAEPPELGRLDG